MYAVVATGGKQLVVEKDSVAVVEKLSAQVGDSVILPALLVADGDSLTVGVAAAGATVTGTVLEHFKGDKQIVFKFKKRKGYKRTRGHRQDLTSVLVTEISLPAPAPKRAARKAAPAAADDPVEEAVAQAAEKPAAKKAPAAKPAAKKPATKETEVSADKAAE